MLPCLGGLPASTLFAQSLNPKFGHVWLEQGLSQSTVNAIAQDSQGFMWFGTQDGLNRFDGYSITVFRHSTDDTSSIASNIIRSLMTDRRGDLWISTVQGVDRYVLSENKMYHYKQKADDSAAKISVSENNVSTLYEDSHGDIWVGTSNRGLNRLNPVTGMFTRFFFGQDTSARSDVTVQSICEDHAENLWVATSEGLLKVDLDSLTGVSGTTAFVRYRHTVSKGTSLTGDNIHILYVDHEGTLWIGTWGAGLYRFDEGRNTFIRYRHNSQDPRSISSDFITSILEDSRGNLWIATQTGGVNVFNPQSETFYRYLDEDVVTLYEDRSGIVWIGTFARGVKAYDWRKDRFKHIYVEPNSPKDLNSNLVSAVLEARDGELWVGTYGGGLHRFSSLTIPTGRVMSSQLLGRDRVRRKIATFEFDPRNSSSLSNNRVLSLCETGDGSIWVGTDGGGLGRLEKRTGRFTLYPALGMSQVSALFADREDNLWIGSNSGDVMSFHVGADRLVRFSSDERISHMRANGPILAICEDKRGTLWVGAAGGVYRFVPDSNETRHYQTMPEPGRSINNNIVTSIYQNDAGIIWIGTGGGGLNRFDPATGVFTYLTEQDGLPNNFVYGILPDSKEQLWLSTNKGISRFDPSSETFRNYDVKDGLQANEFNQGAHFVSARGELFFGGMNGVTAFFPDSIRDNDHVPPVYVTTFKVFDETLPLPSPILTGGQIELPYSHNFFSFEFVALNYTSPEKNRYAYMIEGFDKDWHEASASHRYASYTNLDPGEYILRVRGSNNDGVWNESGTAIAITVTPPFWMTWWFRALVLVAIGGGVIGFYRYRVQQLLKVEEMRVRIAADLHDEIGSSLGSIVLRSRLLQKDVRMTRKSKEELGRIHRTAMQTAAIMRNIVWFVNPDFDTLDDMILKMKDAAQSLLAGIEYEFIAPNKVLSTKLPLEFRRNVFLSYEEILHNIAKHSKATRARIEARTSNGILDLEIMDNGIGFECVTDANTPNATATGNGLRNLKKRMSDLGGQVRIHSTLNQGTMVRIVAKTT